MSNDISGFGSIANLIASVTYPIGVSLTQFSDDTDPINMDNINIAEVAMGLNGDMPYWARANPLPVTIAVIPGSLDDVNLQILADANRVGKGKTSANDVITLTIVYPDSSTIVYSGGKLVSAPFGKSIASAGRLKTRTYSFMFENKTGA